MYVHVYEQLSEIMDLYHHTHYNTIHKDKPFVLHNYFNGMDLEQFVLEL